MLKEGIRDMAECMGGKIAEIVEAEGQIIFGDLAWPKDVRTNFKAYG